MDASQQQQLAKLCNVALVAAKDNEQALEWLQSAAYCIGYTHGKPNASLALASVHGALCAVPFLCNSKISDTYAAISDLCGALECVLTPPNAMIPGKPNGVKGT